VAERPFLTHLFDMLIDQGVEEVVLATGRLAHLIEGEYGASYRSLSIRYSQETEPLGTGGAVKHALPLMAREPFLLLNGDSIAPFDLARMLYLQGREDAGLVLTVCRQADVARFGAVLTDGPNVLELTEKGRAGPGLINCGVYLVAEGCAARLLSMGERFSFEQDVMTPWVRQHSAPFVESPGPFIDIGVPEDYDRAGAVLAELMTNMSR